MMLRPIRPALVLLALFTLVLGGLYPLVVTLLAQGVFPHAADGSIIEKNGKVMGSALIGRQFTSPKYFWGRPSATTPPYHAGGSQASNVSPFSPAHRKAVEERIAALKAADPANRRSIPVELVTASASGLDPHISPAAAEYQLARVARARGMREDALRRLVAKHTAKPQFGMLGEAGVNVLTLNLALDEAAK